MTGRSVDDARVPLDRWLVTAAAVVWVAGTLVGTGAVGGGGVATQGEGLFSDHATLIAPQGPAFSIWSLVYVGLAAWVVWQWLPTSTRSPLAAVSRRPGAASLVLNGLWLLVVAAGWLTASVLVMAGIVVSLGLVLRACARQPREGVVADLVVGVTFGLYLGWICVATCANVASWLVGLGVPVDSGPSTAITVAVLAVVVVLAGALMLRAGRLPFATALAAAVVWGTGWVSAGRFTGELRSDVVGWAAALTAVAVAAVWGATVRRTVSGGAPPTPRGTPR